MVSRNDIIWTILTICLLGGALWLAHSVKTAIPGVTITPIDTNTPPPLGGADTVPMGASEEQSYDFANLYTAAAFNQSVLEIHELYLWNGTNITKNYPKWNYTYRCVADIYPPNNKSLTTVRWIVNNTGNINVSWNGSANQSRDRQAWVSGTFKPNASGIVECNVRVLSSDGQYATATKQFQITQKIPSCGDNDTCVVSANYTYPTVANSAGDTATRYLNFTINKGVTLTTARETAATGETFARNSHAFDLAADYLLNISGTLNITGTNSTSNADCAGGMALASTISAGYLFTNGSGIIQNWGGDAFKGCRDTTTTYPSVGQDQFGLTITATKMDHYGKIYVKSGDPGYWYNVGNMSGSPVDGTPIYFTLDVLEFTAYSGSLINLTTANGMPQPDGTGMAGAACGDYVGSPLDPGGEGGQLASVTFRGGTYTFNTGSNLFMKAGNGGNGSSLYESVNAKCGGRGGDADHPTLYISKLTNLGVWNITAGQGGTACEWEAPPVLGDGLGAPGDGGDMYANPMYYYNAIDVENLTVSGTGKGGLWVARTCCGAGCDDPAVNGTDGFNDDFAITYCQEAAGNDFTNFQDETGAVHYTSTITPSMCKYPPTADVQILTPTIGQALPPLLNVSFAHVPSTPTVPVYCYQEFANTSTSCGGLGNGTYSSTSPATTGLVIDGNYSSSWSASSLGGYVYMNYSKPATASSVLWQTKDEGSITNTTIPDDCFALDPIQLRAFSQFSPGSGFQQGDWQCYNGAAWASVHNPGTNNGFMYEEAMYWAVLVNATDYVVAMDSSTDNLTWFPTSTTYNPWNNLGTYPMSQNISTSINRDIGPVYYRARYQNGSMFSNYTYTWINATPTPMNASAWRSPNTTYLMTSPVTIYCNVTKADDGTVVYNAPVFITIDGVNYTTAFDYANQRYYAQIPAIHNGTTLWSCLAWRPNFATNQTTMANYSYGEWAFSLPPNVSGVRFTCPFPTYNGITPWGQTAGVGIFRIINLVNTTPHDYEITMNETPTNVTVFSRNNWANVSQIAAGTCSDSCGSHPVTANVYYTILTNVSSTNTSAYIWLHANCVNRSGPSSMNTTYAIRQVA
jgi:hypothetical protein